LEALSITRPDDWHLHLRDGEQMPAVLPHTARCFARAIVMPNLKPPVVTTRMALAYRDRIRAALPPGMRFEPLMTLYLTDATSPEEIIEARKSGGVHGVKYYPAGATTNSAAGVTDIARCYETLGMMEEMDLPLLVHGEVTDFEVDVFDKERIFIDRVLIPISQRFPGLRIVFEHITTREAVDFVKAASSNIAATITVHHMLLNRNALFRGGLRPHHYCLPILKREIHRRSVVEAAISGNPKFFLGTDSAPHSRPDKQTACGCAGIFTAHAAIELYAEAFERAGALDKLEAFASFHGPDFYRIARNKDKIMLKKESWTVPATLPFADDVLVPLRAGERIGWRMVNG
jgi:dihydroorotase